MRICTCFRLIITNLIIGDPINDLWLQYFLYVVGLQMKVVFGTKRDIFVGCIGVAVFFKMGSHGFFFAAF